jgi:hypothetical protein
MGKLFMLSKLKDSVIGIVLWLFFSLSGVLCWVAIKLSVFKTLSKLFSSCANFLFKKEQAFREYTPTAHDIMVCSFGKSGTNWVLQIVTQITGCGNMEFKHIHSVVPWVETQHLSYTVGLKEPTYRKSPLGLRAVKTHLEATYVPWREDVKYITIIRDPKDVIISAYYFAIAMMPLLKLMPLNDFIEIFLGGDTLFGSWAAHTTSYWEWRNRPNVLILFYHHMIDDLEKNVKTIAAHMKADLTDGQFQEVIHRSSFDYMQRNDSKFAPYMPGLKRNSNAPIMMRMGKTGSAKTVLNSEQIRTIDEIIQGQLAILGSDFPYRSFFIDEDVTTEQPGSHT